MKKLIFIVLLSYVFSPAYAIHLKDLYKVQVPVSSQLPDAREEAVRLGLLEVLIKLTGDPDIENNPSIKAILRRADYYVEEYRYLPSTTASEKYHIQINYQMNDINRLLKREGIAFWSEKRPLILVWLALTDSQYKTDIIGNENPDAILSIMVNQSKKFGLPIIFPMMDVSEVNKISHEHVTGMWIANLKAAAKPYAPDGLLIGHITAAAEDFYTSDWRLVMGRKQWDWSLSDHDPANLANSIIFRVTQTLAKYYAGKRTFAEQKWLNLQVTNISERDELKVLMKYLSQLTDVQKIELAQVSSGQVNLAVLFSGPIDSFQENANSPKLILKYQDIENNKLIYEWVH